MTLRSKLKIIATAALLSVLSFNTHAVKPMSSEFYSVIFGIIIHESGELKSIRVSKVINPSSNSIKAVNISVPNSYIEAARTFVINKKYKPKIENGLPKEFFTYFFYDPLQPNRVDIDPNE